MVQFLLLPLLVLATEPTISPLPLGEDKGREVKCEGRLSLVQESLNPAVECHVKSDLTCVHLTIESCRVWKDVQAVRCGSVIMEKSQSAKMKALPLVNNPGDTDILQELEKRGIKKDGPSFWPTYRQLSDKKIAQKPKVKVKGRLVSCTECAECGPPKECSLSDCKVELL